MKNLIILILFCSCGALRTQTNSDVKKIEFKSSTRGFQKHITFTKDSIFIKVNSATDSSLTRNYAAKFSAPEWAELTKTIKDVDVSKLYSLAGPTNKRAVDAALASTIIITDKSGMDHTTPDFDDYNPNAELRKLLDAIQQLELNKAETKKLD
ncbi:MAG: hypothetical protein ABI315_09245 [Bacteroidia bacterium]